MAPVLTIALPTYNRAGLLDAQLAWLSRALEGVRTPCEVLLADNCSPDDTPAVIERWRDRLGDDVRVHRHERNLGAVRNIAFCMTEARGRFVWTISDDDAIDEAAVAAVCHLLGRHPDLEVLLLNFSSRDVPTGRLLFDRCFDVDSDAVWPNGQPLFEHLLAPRDPGRWGGLALTTALVYRADRARDALRSWPQGRDNLNVQLYVTAYCATRGPALATTDTFLECASGTHHFVGDTRTHLRFVLAEYAESFVALARLGIDPRLCRRKVLEQPVVTSRRLVARGALRHPLFSLGVARRYLAALWRADRLAGGRRGHDPGLLTR